MAAAIPSKVSKYVDVFVSFGAALVIWGALRKITHAADADMWLWIGLTTEAIIFALYGVLYLIYPAVKDASHDEERGRKPYPLEFRTRELARPARVMPGVRQPRIKRVHAEEERHESATLSS